MSERTEERTQARDVEDLLAEVNGESDTGQDATPSGESETRRTRLRKRAGGLFSLRAFLLALVLTVVGVGLGGVVPLLGAVLRFVGVFGGAFVFGAVSERRHYAEAGLAGALVPGVGTFLNYFALTVAGVALPVIAIAVGLGLCCGLLGHYFGRDLRDGLTREL